MGRQSLLSASAAYGGTGSAIRVMRLRDPALLVPEHGFKPTLP
jgi:hypothetical protein